MPRFALLLLPMLAFAQTDADRIRDLIHTYERSIDLADTALAAQVWSTTPDVTFIHPAGHEHGWQEIKNHVYEKLMGGLFSARRLTAKDISIHVYGDTAWAEFNWDFTATVRASGAPAKTEGRETQIYRKTGHGWRIVHVHYSGPAVAPPQ